MKRIIHTVSIILSILLAAAGGCYGGRRSVKPLDGTTFYAVIEEIREKYILVQGLEINDINGRGAFELTVGDKTELICRGVPITVKDLRIGHMHRRGIGDISGSGQGCAPDSAAG